MKLHQPLFVTLALVAASTVTVYSQVTTSTFAINEFDRVQFGGNTSQFVESFNNGPAAVNLSEYTLGFYDGAATNNALYMSIALHGTLAPGGYYVVGNPGVPNVNQTFSAFTLKTGVTQSCSTTERSPRRCPCRPTSSISPTRPFTVRTRTRTPTC